MMNELAIKRHRPHLFAAVAVLLAVSLATSSRAATVTFVGSLADDTGSQVSAWRTAGTAKTLDPDADNVYGSAGFSIFRGDQGTGSSSAWNAGNFAESQVTGLTLMQAGSAPSLQAGNYNGADDWDDPAGGTRNMGYAGYENTGNNGPIPLTQLFTYGVTQNFSTTLRMGVAAGSLGSTRATMTGLRIVAGGDQDDATIVANPSNNVADMYFFDLTGLQNGDTIEILASDNYTATSPWVCINGVAFDVVPEPSTLALAALGLLGLIGFTRRRR